MNFKNQAVNGFSSIIIPVFKDYKGLKTTLESLQKQDIDKTKYEIIVCNDGGDINISKICDMYQVTEVLIPTNMGSYYARNRGLEQAKGEYIGFVDADIAVNPSWVRLGIQSLSHADYVTGPVEIDSSKAHTLIEKFEVYTALNMEYYFNNNHFAPTANLWIKRELLLYNAAFDERLWSSGDKEFGERLYGTGEYKFYFENSLSVIHPPRNYQDLLKKTKRVAQGVIFLKKLYPQRYSQATIGKCLYKAFFKPWKLTLKKDCNFFLKVVFYIIQRWNCFLHYYYMIQYLIKYGKKGVSLWD